MLLLTGTLASGKTTVAIEVGRQLETAGLPCAVIDLDWLAWVYIGAQFRAFEDLAVRNLLSLWPNLRAVGVQYLVLARASPRRESLARLRDAWEGTSHSVIRLLASPQTIEARLRQRDAGAILREHLTEARDMDASLDALRLEDAIVVNDERTVESVAESVIDQSGWL